MVLLVVDAQKQIVTEKLYNYKVFIENVQRLIRGARDKGAEVIYIRHDDGERGEIRKGTKGFEIYEAFKPEGKEKIFDKTVNSAFRNTGLLEYLKQKNIKDIVIAGLQTDYCIDAAVKCGFEHGFHIIVPENANSTTDNCYMSGESSYHYYNKFIWNGRYAECISVEETIERFHKRNMEKV